MKIGLGLSLTGMQRRRDTPFNPAALFASGEQGVWLDPDDPATLFSDTAGTTQAGIGDPVALALSKDKGLVLGPEGNRDPDFDDPSLWTAPGEWMVSEGSASITNSSAGFNLRDAALVPVPGRFYEVTVTIASITSGLLGIFENGANNSTTLPASPGTYQRLILVGSGATIIALRPSGTGVTASVSFFSVRELPGNHATQPTLASRPILREADGLRYLEFDGVDDSLVTPTITPGTDKVQVFAGVRKLSDALGNVCELSPDVATHNGSLLLVSLGVSGYRFSSRSTNRQNANSEAQTVPITNAITALGDISGSLAALRIDGTQAAQVVNNQGTGNYLAYPLNIGSRNGASQFLNSHIYSLITRFGDNLDTATIARTEGYVAQRTGVSL